MTPPLASDCNIFKNFGSGLIGPKILVARLVSGPANKLFIDVEKSFAFLNCEFLKSSNVLPCMPSNLTNLGSFGNPRVANEEVAFNGPLVP